LAYLRGKPLFDADGSDASRLVASELFGHRKGSFTGATTDRIGLIEHCNGGTLFLDEIGDLPHDVQVMLLQALREKKIRRLGSDDFVEVDFQLLSATNHDTEMLVNAGRLRADLYHRIRGVQIMVPSLRTRFQEDPDELFRLIEREQESAGFPFRFTQKAQDLLRQHPWPGNVAELKTLIMELTTLCSTVVDDDMVANCLLKPEYFAASADLRREESILMTPNYRTAMRDFRDLFFEHWIAESGGIISDAARRINVNPTTLHRWKKRLSKPPE
jgi:DNA-binding NtrC family response regulator